MLAGVLTPDAGTVQLGHETKIAYFSQNHSDIVSKEEKFNAFEWLQARRSGIYDQEVRSAMGKMLFGGDDAFKRVATLSGGETARLIMAGITLSEHNVLIMDEPNNHLDLEAVSALGWGLQEYKGTAIVASHDRDLVDHFATKIIAFEADETKIFNGGLEDYLKQVK